MTKAEREVSHFLKEIGIEWSYEHPVFVWDENKRPRVWAPDFQLIQFGIYVEVCGSKDFDYHYRRKIFDNNGYRVIFLHLYKDPFKWKHHFLFYLKLFTNYRKQNLNTILSNGN